MPIKKVTKWIVTIALFLIPIFPLIVSNSYYFPFITGKAFYFRIIIEIAFASWIILACLDPKYRPKLNALTVGVTLFAFVTLIADLLGMNPVRSLWSNFERMEGWMTIIHLWAFFIIAMSMFGHGEESKRMWHRFFNFSLFIALIIAVYALFQYFGVLEVHQSSSRVDATLGNAAYMAVYMLFHVFIAAYFFFVGAEKKGHTYSFLRWLSGLLSVTSIAMLFETVTLVVRAPHYVLPIVINVIVLGVMAYIISKWHTKILPTSFEWMYSVLFVVFSFILLETQTRGTILGLIGGMLLILFLYAVLGKKELKVSRWVSGGIIIVSLLLSLVFWIERNSSFIQSNPVLGRLATISLQNDQTQARAYIWPMALKGFIQRPILGWGQESFNYLFNANYNPKMYAQEQWFDRAHSVFLDWLVAAGGIGLLAYLALYVLFLTTVWKSSLTIIEKSVLTGLIAAYAVHNVFVFDNLASYAMFFAFLGFAGSLGGGKHIKWLGTEAMRIDAVEYIVAPIVIIVLAIGLYFINVRTIQANSNLITALSACNSTGHADANLFKNALDVNSPVAGQEIREQLLICSGNVISGQYPGPIKQAFYQITSTAIEDQEAATPKDARIYMLAGSFYNSIGHYPQAQALLETAHKLSPAKQSIDFELASAYLANANNDPSLKDKSVDLLKKAYESETDDTSARQAYAISLIIDGKEDVAKTTFNNDPTIFETQQMAGIYNSLKQYQKAIDIYTKLVAADPKNIDLNVGLARVQFAAGMLDAAKSTLRSMEKDHPELTDQIEAAIKTIK